MSRSVTGLPTPGLHLAPPTVVGAAEAHQVAAPGVVAGQAHGLHHGFGAGHVEGDLVESGEGPQAVHVAGGHRMVGPEHRAQVPHPGAAAFNAFLVEVVAKHIHAVGAGQVVAPVAVQIGGGGAAGGDDEGSRVQVLADEAAELEGYAVARRELQI